MIRRTLRLLAFVLIGLLGGGLAAFSCSSLRLPFGLTINSPDLFSRGGGKAVAEAELVQRIRVPEGFHISTWFGGIPNNRVLRFTDAGDLLVSSPRTSRIYLLKRDGNGDGKPDGSTILMEGLNDPHGLALRDGYLYVAETDAVLRVKFDAASGTVHGDRERIITGLPGGGNHWRRVIDFGPDGWLYVAVGSSCNVCIEDDPRRAAINRFEPTTWRGEIYATGLRNSAGFDWQPGTDVLYATDNGRDLLGDDFPPCELNRVTQGGFYGWPYANGDKVPDPDFGTDQQKVAQSLAPAFAFGAHNAPLGITFYEGTAFPERYRGAAFVALHGSWNRSTKAGYKVVALFFNPDGTIRQEDFITGFEENENVIGRPTYFAVGPDGALYVSDDYSGAIYRVAYGDKVSGAAGVAVPQRISGDPLAGLDATNRRAAADRGRISWDKHPCAACHMSEGTQAPGLHDLAKKYDINSLADFLRSPQPPMPQFPMSDEERRDLAIYLLERFH